VRHEHPPPQREVTPPQVAAKTRTRLATARGSRPHVGLCMVMSLDGRTVVDSHSRHLSGPADLAMLIALRRIADVVIVGASTAIIDTYDQSVRQDLPIGVVTRTARLDPTSPLFATGPGFLITPEDTSIPDGFKVVRAGIGTVDLPRALEQIDGDFAQLEGGPNLNAAMFAADLVDEINVTVSASLVGGKGPALATSAIPLMHRYELAHVVTDDGFAFLRYLRAR
jgi:5-amino-6-(5-phosphoribosylamino)uracil reductase